MQYLNFDVEISAGSDQDYALVVRSLAGETRTTLQLPWAPAEFDHLLQDLQEAIQPRELQQPHPRTLGVQAVQAFGQQLFEALFQDEVRSRYDVTKEQASQKGMGVRLRLCLLTAELAILPWEYLYDPRRGEYCCLSGHTPLVRYVAVPQPIKPLQVKLPLHVLGMIANPSDQEPLDIAQERQHTETALQPLVERGLVRLTWLEGQTWRDLLRAMREGPWHVFHFIGHGGFDESRQEGVLALVNERGTSHLLHPRQVSRLLADHPSMRVVFLNADEDGKGNPARLFSNIAATLAQQGVPAVLAMQAAMSDQAAMECRRSFYEALADGLPVDGALAEARKAISVGGRDSLEWGVPVLYLRATEGVLFHRTRPSRTGKRTPLGASNAFSTNSAEPGTHQRPQNYLPFFRNMLFQPRPGEFEHLERLLFVPGGDQQPRRIGLLGVVGMGGVGKTQLAAELAYHYQERFPDGIFWMTATGNQTDWQHQLALLASRTNYLPTQDDPADPEQELRRACHFARYLADHPGALLILDNVEQPHLIVSALPTLAGREPSCTLLYTSRVSTKPFGVVTYPVEVLPEEAALRLLLATTRPVLLAETLGGSQGLEHRAARDLCKKVGYLPLGLVHLRGLLESDSGLTLVRLFEVLNERGVLEIAQDPSGEVIPLFATFTASWEKVQQEDAQRLFKLAGYFPEAAPIPLWLLGLAAGLGESAEPWNPLGKALQELTKWSLLEKLAGGEIRLHPLVREFAHQLVGEEPDQEMNLIQAAGEHIRREFENLNELEKRARMGGFWGCMEQVHAAHSYCILLGADQAGNLVQIELMLNKESGYLGTETFWPEKLPGFFFQQLYNRATRQGNRSTGEPPRQWVRLLASVEAEDDALLRIFAGHQDRVSNVAFSPDGTQILTGSSKEVRLWETNGRLLDKFSKPFEQVWDELFASEQAHIQEPGINKITTKDRAQAVRSSAPIPGQVLAFSADGSQVLTPLSARTITEDEIVYLWDVVTGKRLMRFAGHQGRVQCAAFSPDGTRILTGSHDQTARLWEVSKGRNLAIFTGHQGVVWSVAFSPDGAYILTGSSDQTARLWEVARGKSRMFARHDNDQQRVAFSPDGHLLLVGSQSGKVQLWEVDSGKLETLADHQNSVNCVAFSSDGNRFVTASADRQVRLWDANSKQILKIIHGRREYTQVHSIDLSPDGSQVAMAVEGNLALWSVNDQEHPTVFSFRDTIEERFGKPSTWVSNCAFSPDENNLLFSTDDGAIYLKSLATLKTVRKFKGHESRIWSIAFSHDGEYFLTGSSDRTARLWDTSSGKPLLTFTGYKAGVRVVSLTPDKSIALTCDEAGQVCIWGCAGHQSGRLLGVFPAPYPIGAVYWQGRERVILADQGGTYIRPLVYRLKLEGI